MRKRKKKGERGGGERRDFQARLNERSHPLYKSQMVRKVAPDLSDFGRTSNEGEKEGAGGQEGTRRDGGGGGGGEEMLGGKATGQKHHSPEGAEVVLMFHVREVWLTGDGDELAAGLPGTLGGNEPAPSASSLNGSAWRGGGGGGRGDFTENALAHHNAQLESGRCGHSWLEHPSKGTPVWPPPGAQHKPLGRVALKQTPLRLRS